MTSYVITWRMAGSTDRCANLAVFKIKFRMVLCFAACCNHSPVRDTCSFFRFPKDKELKALWIRLSRGADKMQMMVDPRLCSCHFKDGKKENNPTIYIYCEKSSLNLPKKRAQKNIPLMGHCCKFCEKYFSTISTFNRHLRLIHNEDPVSTIKNIICPNETCMMKFARKISFFKHLEEIHQIHLEFEKKEFPTYAKFYAWKDDIVRETDCRYSKKSSQLLVKGEKVEYFNCNGCGIHNPQARLRKYRTCPSLMNVVVTENRVFVKFQKTHYGHSVNSACLFTPDQYKLGITCKLVPGEEDKSQNIPFITYLSEEQNLDIASDFSDGCSSSEIIVTESDSENVSSSVLLESNKKEVAALRGKLDSISSANQKESILLESNKQEMALLSEKLNSISSMDKKASVQIKYYLNAIEHLIEVQAATTTDSELPS